MGDDANLPPDPGAPPKKRSFKQRLEALIDEYGKTAIIIYLTLSLLTITGFSIAIGAGWQPSDATDFIGVIVAGWAASKLTMPIRVPITLAITPWVAKRLKRRAEAREQAADDAAIHSGSGSSGE